MIIFLLSLIAPLFAQADCQWNASRTFYGCSTLGYFTSVGRSLPQISDTIRFNPGALPTVPTPIGVEGSYHSKPGSDPHFQGSIIKGFQRIGFGLVSWNENTFSTPNLERYLSTQFANYQTYAQSNRQGFRFGSAFALPLADLENYLHLSLGAQIGQGKAAGGSSQAYAIALNIQAISLGITKGKEKLSPLLPEADVTTLSIGGGLRNIFFGYTRTNYDIGGIALEPIHFYSARFSSEKWAIHGAMKKDYDYSTGKKTTTKTATLQRTIGKQLILGYIYGFYPNSHSLSTQFFF